MPNIWREVYAHTLAGLFLAFILYGVAALSGLVSKKPLFVFLIATSVAVILYVGSWVIIAILYRHDLVMWFKNPRTGFSTEEDRKRARRIYQHSSVAIGVFIFCAYALVLLLNQFGISLR